MPRAIWSGAISFGLVNIPVKLYNAVSRKNVSFHQIDLKTNSRVRQRRVAEADGSEVPREQIAKGYELSSGDYVILTDDELSEFEPESSRTIDIEAFVDLAEIDPLFYDSAYLVAPDKATTKPYALLCRAMEDAGRVGIARFVMRTKQYLAAVRPVDGHLVLSTMVYADEIVPAGEVPELADLDDPEVPERELTMAHQLIDSLAGPWEPEAWRDTYRERLLERIEAKAAGEAETLRSGGGEAAEGNVVDLMAALEASVAEAKKARERHPTANDAPAGDGDAADGEVAGGKKPATRKAGGKKKAAAKKSA